MPGSRIFLKHASIEACLFSGRMTLSGAIPSVNDILSADAELSDAGAQPARAQEPRLWVDDGWTARVIKNEDDDGWAVEMIKDGQAEPALVGPWTMGRDKKNPKPLDSPAFITLVKTANEVLRRHEQQLHAMLHKNVKITASGGTLTVKLDIVPDEDEPHAWLSAHDEFGEQVARQRVAPDFKLSVKSASAWAGNDFKRPG